MKSKKTHTSKASSSLETDRIADFVLFTQRSCILNLSGELAEGKVSFPQFFLLTYLSSEDFLTMSDIAKKMGHSTAAATGMVDRLEKHDLVERVHAAEDRRRILVQITRKGTQLVAKMRKRISSDLSSLMEHLDEDELDALNHTRRAIRRKPKSK